METSGTRWEYLNLRDGRRLAYVTESAPLPSLAAMESARAADRLRRLLSYSQPGDDELVELNIITASDKETVVIPAVSLGIFADVLDDLSEGRAVAVAPFDLLIGSEETSRQLAVSRTWVDRLADTDALACIRIGLKRRFKLGDVSAYRRESARKRRDSSAAAWAFLDDEVIEH